MTGEVDPARVWLFQALLLVAMTTYIGMSGLAAALSIKLMDVLYVPRIW
jgi:flagellar biosynthesis protein FliQ